MWQGMHVTAYSPLGTPGSGSITHRAKNVPVLLQDPLVQSIAQKHNKHPAQVNAFPQELKSQALNLNFLESMTLIGCQLWPGGVPQDNFACL